LFCLNYFLGNSQLVLKPKTTNEVSKILTHCNSKNLAVVPQAGNTSLSGGHIAIYDEIIISMSLMNQIENLDEISGHLNS
jgi:FAD/FMN-containing dehydrogenase